MNIVGGLGLYFTKLKYPDFHAINTIVVNYIDGKLID